MFPRPKITPSVIIFHWDKAQRNMTISVVSFNPGNMSEPWGNISPSTAVYICTWSHEQTMTADWKSQCTYLLLRRPVRRASRTACPDHELAVGCDCQRQPVASWRIQYPSQHHRPEHHITRVKTSSAVLHTTIETQPYHKTSNRIRLPQ